MPTAYAVSRALREAGIHPGPDRRFDGDRVRKQLHASNVPGCTIDAVLGYLDRVELLAGDTSSTPDPWARIRREAALI